MIRILVTALTSGVVVAASAAPAGATTLQGTVIENFTSSVAMVTYQQPVTFTGELVGSGTTPVPGEPVQIQIQPPSQSGFVPVATGTTGADGQFTITTTLPSGGFVRAAFAGDTGLAPGYSTPAYGMILAPAHLPSRLVLDPVPGSVSAGKAVTFSGTMQVQVSGSWQPFEGAPLTLTMEPDTSSQPNVSYAVTTDADGRFSLTRPLSETSDWSVSTTVKNACWEDWFPDCANAGYGLIDAVSRTRVTGFSLPAKKEAHSAWASGLYATGTAERWNGSAWVGLAYGAVQFYYRPKGSTTWHKDDGAQVGASGYFHSQVGIHLGTVHWQARVIPAADTLRSTSTNSVAGTITDRTHFASVSIQRRPSGSSVSGQVTDWRKGQVSFSSLRGLKLRLYYRHKGSTAWHYYKAAKVGSHGLFHFSEAKSQGYYFKVRLPAQGPFLSCGSRTL